MISGLDCFEHIFHMIFDRESRYHLCECYTKSGWKFYTYREYLWRIYGIADLIENEWKEIPQGSWVGLKVRNHPLWSAILWALLMQGYNVVIIDHHCEQAYLDNIMKHSGAKALVASELTEESAYRYIDFNRILECNPMQMYQNRKRFADKIALCTSGTTGTPKIYVHTGKQIGAQMNSIMERYRETEELFFLLGNGEKRTLSMFPFHHISAMILNILYQVIDGTMIMMEQESITRVITAIKDGRVQIAYSVPMIWNSIVQYLSGRYGVVDTKVIQEVMGPQLKLVIMGAAKASPETMRILNDANIFSSEAYGMTEIGSLTSNINKTIDGRVNGAVGRVTSDFYQAKVYQENGAVSEEGIGELIVSGDVVYVATLAEGKEIPRKCSLGDYFFTGDLVEIRQGELFILGRKKDVIVNSSGENIYPEELEEYFGKVKEYSDAYVVVGVEEHPVMVLSVREDGKSSGLIDMIKDLNYRLPVYKRLTAVYLWKGELPVTSNGKIKRTEIKRSIAADDDMYPKYDMKG